MAELPIHKKKVYPMFSNGDEVIANLHYKKIGMRGHQSKPKFQLEAEERLRQKALVDDFNERFSIQNENMVAESKSKGLFGTAPPSEPSPITSCAYDSMPRVVSLHYKTPINELPYRVKLENIDFNVGTYYLTFVTADGSKELPIPAEVVVEEEVNVHGEVFTRGELEPIEGSHYVVSSGQHISVFVKTNKDEKYGQEKLAFKFVVPEKDKPIIV